jgi:hypothetical protein
MCDEYEEERMAMFWRRLEQMEGRKQIASEPTDEVEPLVRIEPSLAETQKTKPRTLAR